MLGKYKYHTTPSRHTWYNAVHMARYVKKLEPDSHHLSLKYDLNHYDLKPNVRNSAKVHLGIFYFRSFKKYFLVEHHFNDKLYKLFGLKTRKV
jgi:hypothetical protein